MGNITPYIDPEINVPVHEENAALVLKATQNQLRELVREQHRAACELVRDDTADAEEHRRARRYCALYARENKCRRFLGMMMKREYPDWVKRWYA